MGPNPTSNRMTILQSLVLGVVEGLTEFLPVSSTGHLILASSLLGIAQTEFVKTFEIAIQLGAILAVVVLYWKSFLNVPLLQKIIVAFIPTAVIGLAFYTIVKTYLIGNELVVLGALFLGGIALIAFEQFHAERTDAVSLPELSYKNAVLIGLAQAVAVIPGVSRSAATILGGLALNLKRTAIVEFSFLLAVPTMLAATGFDLFRSGPMMSLADGGILAGGFVSAFVVAMLTIKFLLRFIQKHSFVGFGVYRILVALAFWLMIL